VRWPVLGGILSILGHSSTRSRPRDPDPNGGQNASRLLLQFGPGGKGGLGSEQGQKKYTNRESNPGTKNGNLRCCHYIISVKMHLVRNSRVFSRFELTLPKELRLECSALDHNRIDIRRLGHRCMFERRPMSASSGRADSVKFGVCKSFNRKTRDSGIDPLISRFDPCSPDKKPACASETRKNPN
jgi:hypothetical protein